MVGSDGACSNGVGDETPCLDAAAARFLSVLRLISLDRHRSRSSSRATRFASSRGRNWWPHHGQVSMVSASGR